MAELDAFELRLRSAVRRYLDDAPSEVDAAVVVRRAVADTPPRRSLPDLPTLRLSPTFAWSLLVVLLLLIAAALLVVGADRNRGLPAVVPPALAACPAGSTPDQPGPAKQDRPLSDQLRMVFDRASGRIVALVPIIDGSGWDTWIFDPCANTWTRAAPATGAPGGDSWPSVVYDTDSDVTIAFDFDGSPWVYDLEADTWVEKASAVEQVGTGRFGLVDDPVSGLVYALRVSPGGEAAPPQDVWTYNVDSDAWASVRQTGAVPSGTWGSSVLYAYDRTADRIVRVLAHANRSAAWRFDPRSGEWAASRSATPLFNTGFFASGGEVAFDEVSGRTVVFSDGVIAAYDAIADQWASLDARGARSFMTGPLNRVGHWMAYDPINHRLVVAGGQYRTPDGWVRADDVWAFDTVSGTWTQLLAPSHKERYDSLTDTWQPAPDPSVP